MSACNDEMSTSEGGCMASCEKTTTKCPLLLVHGFMGFGRDWYWRAGVHYDNENVILAKCGPTSSLHDRACEIFYSLVGGTVDYGAEHAQRFGHDRFGVTYIKAEHPRWSEAEPIHVLGHSLGGITGRILQHYLANQMFPGYNTNANWIRSITTLSSPHNGTAASYILGADEFNPGGVHLFSFGWIASRIAHLYELFNLYGTLGRFGVDLQLTHWNFSSTTLWKVPGVAINFLNTMIGKSPMFDSCDNATYDMTLHGMKDWNTRLTSAYPNTYYHAFVTTASQQPTWSEHHWPDWMVISPPLLPLSYWLGRFKPFSPDLADGYDHEDCFRNDGICSAFSQAHPHGCDYKGDVEGKLHCHHADLLDMHPLEPGIWMVTGIPETDHIGVVVRPKSQKKHSQFFEALFARLHAIDSLH